MKILVACEESQTVCKAFRRKGHIAFSCDIEPCSGGFDEWHIQGNVLPLLNGNCIFYTIDGKKHQIVGKWDMILAFPPCTYLTSAGTRHYSAKCNPPEKIKERELFRDDAVLFFLKFINADCNKIVVENPVGYMNTHFRKPDQIIHPYFFGENYQKRTCLWLKGVEKLQPTNMLPKPEPVYINSKGRRVHWCDAVKAKGGQKERSKLRSKTFKGVADAMANQWG